MRTADDVSAMLCPVCKVSLAMSDRQGIEIDYCPQCRGIWLDRGELDKIIERNAAPAAPARPLDTWGRDRFAEERYHGGSKDPRRKRKSWLEEIFD